MGSFDPLDNAVSYGRHDFGSDQTNWAGGDAGSASRWQDALRSFGYGGTDQPAQTQDGSAVRSDGPNATPLLAAAVLPVAGGDGGGIPDKDWAAGLAKDPKPLVGKTAQEVAKEFTDHGFKATVEQSTQGSGRAQMVRIEKSPVGMVEIHPGEGSHGGAYTKVSTDNGKFKYVDPETYVRRSPEPRTKFFDSRTGAPIEESSLPLRGGPKAAPAADSPVADAPGRGKGPSAGTPPDPAPADPPVVKPPTVEPPTAGATAAGEKGAAAAENAATRAGQATEALGKAGKILVPVAVAANVVQLGQAFHQDGDRIGNHTGETASGIAGSWGGALAGAEGGALVGGAVGSVVPGVGTAAGALVGGVVGGIGGAIGGDWAGRRAYEGIKGLF